MPAVFLTIFSSAAFVPVLLLFGAFSIMLQKRNKNYYYLARQLGFSKCTRLGGLRPGFRRVSAAAGTYIGRNTKIGIISHGRGRNRQFHKVFSMKLWKNTGMEVNIYPNDLVNQFMLGNISPTGNAGFDAGFLLEIIEGPYTAEEIATVFNRVVHPDRQLFVRDLVRITIKDDMIYGEMTGRLLQYQECKPFLELLSVLARAAANFEKVAYPIRKGRLKQGQ